MGSAGNHDTHDINSRPTECLHASVVVQRRIHTIYTDSVDSKLLEVGQVTLTCGCIGEGVDESAWLRERCIGVHISNTWERHYIYIQKDQEKVVLTLLLICDSLDEKATSIRVIEVATGPSDLTDGIYARR